MRSKRRLFKDRRLGGVPRKLPTRRGQWLDLEKRMLNRALARGGQR